MKAFLHRALILASSEEIRSDRFFDHRLGILPVEYFRYVNIDARQPAFRETWQTRRLDHRLGNVMKNQSIYRSIFCMLIAVIFLYSFSEGCTFNGAA